jgi:hypothetical protein
MNAKTSTPVSPPSSDDLARYPDMLAMEGDPMPGLEGNKAFACGVLQTKLHEACALIDELRCVISSACDRKYFEDRVDRFFSRLQGKPIGAPHSERADHDGLTGEAGQRPALPGEGGAS